MGKMRHIGQIRRWVGGRAASCGRFTRRLPLPRSDLRPASPLRGTRLPCAFALLRSDEIRKWGKAVR